MKLLLTLSEHCSCVLALEEAVILPRITVNFGLSSKGINGPFLFEGTVTGTFCLQMLQEKIMSCPYEMYSN